MKQYDQLMITQLLITYQPGPSWQHWTVLWAGNVYEGLVDSERSLVTTRLN